MSYPSLHCRLFSSISQLDGHDKKLPVSQGKSTAGVNGDCSLRKPKTEISFYDVIKAIEGSGALFTCEMNENGACPIEKVMRDTEEKMVNDLKEIRNHQLYALERSV